MDIEFQNWYENVADIPEFKNGVWVDVETGIEFKKSKKTRNKKTAYISNRVKSVGGKPLSGTEKQKKWGEAIREEKIRSMSEEDASIACDKNGLLNHSKFWIENRHKQASDIVTFNKRRKELQALHASAVESNNVDDARILANEYNSLTSEWGF